MDMETLITEWSELEPDRCVGVSVVVNGHFVNLAYENYIAAVILLAITQAIEARGWDWDIKSDIYGIKKYYCHISDGSVNGMRSRPGGEDSPAEALLSTYLEALKSINDCPKCHGQPNNIHKMKVNE